VSAEVLLEPGQDRSRRSDGELLACDLEGERPEGVERGELADPRARAEVGMRVDHPRQDRIRVPEELAHSGIGERIGSGGAAEVIRSGRHRGPP
jgi:hypothetical protein